VAPLEIR